MTFWEAAQVLLWRTFGVCVVSIRQYVIPSIVISTVLLGMDYPRGTAFGGGIGFGLFAFGVDVSNLYMGKLERRRLLEAAHAQMMEEFNDE